MAIEHQFTLSTTEPNNNVGLVKVRQSDVETQIFQPVVIKNGKIMDLTGYKAFFSLKTGTTTGIVEQEAEIVDAKNGRVDYTLNKYDWQKGGKNSAYFSFRKLNADNSWKEQFSTRDFEYIVTNDIYSKGITDSNYVWTFEDLLRYLNEGIENGLTDTAQFMEDVRQIVEGIEPGGQVVTELVDSRSGYESLDDRLKTIDKSLGMINFTFDGAFNEDKLTKSIFDEYGFVCSFAVPVDWINTFNGIEFYRNAQREGYGIEAFSRTHLNMINHTETIDMRIIQREIADSAPMYKEMGLTVNGYTSPVSRTAKEYEHFITQNYDYAINGLGVQDESMRAVQDALINDRYHLCRMSLAYNSLESIKQAIDKAFKEKKFLLFYDHKTGAGEGNVSVEKLRAILDYIKIYIDEKKGYVSNLSDIIANKYEKSLGVRQELVVQSSNLAPPLGRIGVAMSVPYYDYWGYGMHGSTTTQDKVIWNAETETLEFQLVNSKQSENRSVQMCVDLTKFKGDRRPHKLSMYLPIWMNNLAVLADITIDCRFYDTKNIMIGPTKTTKINVTDERVALGIEYSIPRENRDFSWAHIYVRINNLKDNTGTIFLQQPSVKIDDNSYSDVPAVDYSLSSMDFKQEVITVDRTWKFLLVDTQYSGVGANGLQHFDTVKGQSAIVAKISGLYEFRLNSWATLLDEATTTGASYYIEIRVNDNIVANSQANRRFNFLKQDFVKGVLGGQLNLTVPIQAGDEIRLAVFKNTTGGTLSLTNKPVLTIQKLGNYK